MALEEDLRTLILAGQGVPPRVHWLKRSQAGELPAITLQRITGLPDYHMQGPSGLTESRVQADVWAAGYGDAKFAARALVARVSGFRGVQGSTNFQAIMIDGMRDDYEGGSNTAEDFFRVIIDMIIQHNEV